MKLYLRSTLAALLSCSVAGFAQQAAPPISHTIHLDVTVTDKSGNLVPGLTQQDFTVLDNKATRAPASFRAVNPGDAKVSVVLLIDNINDPDITASRVRENLHKFLEANPKLPHPTSIGVMTDTNLQWEPIFTNDSKALDGILDKYGIGLQPLGAGGGAPGAAQRIEKSLTGLRLLSSRLASTPGRKIVIVFSGGWPLLSSTAIRLDLRQAQQIFANAVDMSTRLRQGEITLDMVNPYGSRAVGRDALQFVKGLSKPGGDSFGNLALQVLAIQSGGLMLEASNDIAGMVQQCYADSNSWYEIAFPMPATQQPDEYHHLDVKVDKPDLTDRTREGYYAEP